MSLKHWIVQPKQCLLEALKSFDDGELLCEITIIKGGDKFGHSFTGEAFVRAGSDYFTAIEEAQKEWVKLVFLSNLENEYNSKLFDCASPYIGTYEISENFFDKWWEVIETEEVVNADESFEFSKETKFKIKTSANEFVSKWLEQIKNVSDRRDT